MRFSVDSTGLGEATRDIRRLKAEVSKAAEGPLRREALRAVGTIQRRYRSLSEPAPHGTAVRTGTLRGSYSQSVRREDGAWVGEYGLYSPGELPTYFERWEGQLDDQPGRPTKGAIEEVRPDTARRIEKAVTDAIDRVFR